MARARFDALARAVARHGSRRALLRALAAGVPVAALAARFQPPAARAAAGCADDGNECEIDKDCCSGGCGADGRCLLSPGARCKAKARCASGICKGKPKKKRCRCGDGRQACAKSCCAPNATCEDIPGGGRSCFLDTGRQPGDPCSNPGQCAIAICTGGTCRCGDGREVCGFVCCESDQTCQLVNGVLFCVEAGED